MSGIAAGPPGASSPIESSFRVEVDLDAIADNVAALDRQADGAEVMAVVKADGYGHGLLPAAQAALAGGATHIGVAQLSEAVAARRAGLEAPLLAWLYAPGADLTAAVEANIEVTVSAPWQLQAVTTAAHALGRTATIHLKVDTGLARGGALGEGFDELLAVVGPAHADGAVAIGGTWTHFAYADAPEHPTVCAQQDTFADAVQVMRRVGLPTGRLHVANSAATLTNPSAHLDMVRPGIAVYGLSPAPDLGEPGTFGLTEAMRVTARLSLVKRAQAGQGVSYGHSYHTDRDTVLGLVPMGYADGLPRHGGNAAPVALAGRRHTIAGRVCMDQIVLDLGPDFDGAAGDEVVIIGRGADGEPTAQDWAEAVGTISYEIVTRMAPRAPRTYVGGRSAVASP